MYKLWMHARANIKKTKSVSATLVVMFLIAALLLNVGLLVAIRYGSFFGQLKEELAPAEAYFALPQAVYTQQVQDYISQNEHVKKAQTNEALALGAEITQKGKKRSYTVLLQNMDEKREISKWKYVGKHRPATEMSVYVPDIFKAVGGYQLGDKMTLHYTDQTTGEKRQLTFTVQGYTEDIFFSSTDTGMMGFYLPQETYRQVADILQGPSYRMHLVHTRLDEVKSASAVEAGIRQTLGLDSSSMMAGDSDAMLIALDIELIELSRCMMATMIAAMMVLFALIIVVVCLLVVRFRIVNSIEDDLMKIGSLKAIGYTGRQIRLSLLIQYLLIAGLGSLLGIGASYGLLPSISMIFEQQSGLKWEQGFDVGISASALLVLLAVVVLVVVLATRRVNHLSPIRALRGESTVHKYRHNMLPLERAHGPLSVTLAGKSILQNIKQNIMVVMIMIAVTFAGAYGIIMYYNTAIDTKAFAEVPGMEITNVIAALNEKEDQSSTVAAIKDMEHVRLVQYLDEVKLEVDGTQVSSYVMGDYAGKQTRLVYEGRYPQKDGEIVLAGILADRIGKGVGDLVAVRWGDSEETFRVTGLSNGSSMGGLNTSIRTADMRRLNADFKPQILYIHLDTGTDSASFIEQLNDTFDSQTLLSVTNFDKGLAEGMASYQNIVAAMGLAMLIITLAVVTLVLYFMISSSVVRQKRDLGVQKAIGFTTFQLMNQLSLTYVAPVAVGAAAGSLLGALYTNPMMSVAMRGVGIMKAGFLVDPLWVVAFGLGTVVFSYLLSLLTTWRIRKISAYALVTE